MITYAAVRCSNFTRFQALAAQTRHGRGIDVSARSRAVRGGPRGLAASCLPGAEKLEFVPVGDDSDRTDLVAAYRHRKKEAGASERKSAAFAMHLLAIISPEWVHSPERVRKLTKAAHQWAEQSFGKGSVFAVRYDVNERGKGVVDLYVAPVRKQKIGRYKKERIMLAPSAARGDLAEQMGRKRSQQYTALQDSWAKFCATHLDPKIQRGNPKALTGKGHMTPEEFGLQKDIARERKRADQAIEAAGRQERVADEADESRLELIAENDRLRQQNKKAEAEVLAAMQRAEEADARVAQAEAEIKAMRRELRQVRVKVTRAEDARQKAEALAARAEQTAKQATGQLAAVRSELTQANETLDRYEQTSGTTLDALTEARARLKDSETLREKAEKALGNERNRSALWERHSAALWRIAPKLFRRMTPEGKAVAWAERRAKSFDLTGHHLEDLEEGRDELIVSAAVLKAIRPQRFARVWKESKAKRLLKEIGRLARQFLGRGAPAC